MTDNQRRLWGELLADAPHGLLRRSDRQLFTNYVVLADRLERAAVAQNALDAVAAAPMLMQPAGTVSPYIRIMNQATMLMNALQGELGFTPSARARMGVPVGGFGDDREPMSAHEMFDVVLPNGQVIPYAARK
jgi:phage terminase small subunit